MAVGSLVPFTRKPVLARLIADSFSEPSSFPSRPGKTPELQSFLGSRFEPWFHDEMSGDESDASRSEEKLRWFEEQIAFLERELEHHKEQIAALWSELSTAKRQIVRLTRRVEEEREEEYEG